MSLSCADKIFIGVTFYANISHQYNLNTCWKQSQLGPTENHTLWCYTHTCTHACTHTHTHVHTCQITSKDIRRPIQPNGDRALHFPLDPTTHIHQGEKETIRACPRSSWRETGAVTGSGHPPRGLGLGRSDGFLFFRSKLTPRALSGQPAGLLAV